jgi:formylglycine-generating enzyme required for sulfatase activity
MAALLAALAPRPAARRRWLAAAVALLVVAGWLGLRGDAERDALARAALAARDAAAELRAAADAARDEALAHFAAGRRDAGEAAWARHLAAARRCDEQLRVAGDGLARLLAGEPDDALRAARVDVLLARAALAEATHRAGDLQAHRAALAAELGPDELRARWDLPAQLTVTSDPPGAEVLLAGSLRGPLADPLADPHRVSAAERLGVTPLPAQARPAGYYVLRLRRAGHPDVAQPLLLGRGEALTLAFALPAAVPDGFVHVPAGRFLYGAGTGSADEPRRHGLYAEPLQPRSTGAFLVGRDEVTWGEYLAYLDDLAPDDRGAALPGAAQPLAVGLAAGPRGWTLTLGDERRAAGEPLRARGGLAEDIDWRRLPVLGVTVAQARGYAGWLARRVPGARLCTDLEWEKAARGVDGRVAPDMWAPPGAASERGPGGGPTGGPVPVGTRPATSPFGLRDVQGNAAEIVVAGGEYLLRGGSYHAARPALRLDAREPLAPDARDARAGFRVCASP